MLAASGLTGPNAPWRRFVPVIAQGLPRAGRWAALGGALSVFPFLAGAVLALGAAQIDLLLFGAVCGLGFLFVPASTVLGLLVLLTFIVVGLASYFLSFDKGFWLPYMICMLLFLKLPVEALQVTRRGSRVKTQTSAVVYVLAPFLAVFVLSTLSNGTPVMAVLVGAKNFVFVWSVLLLLALGRLDEKLLARIWQAVLWIAVLQLPFTIYQHFFVAAGNANGVRGLISWDAVVGTFGGKIDGGGSSGTLAVFEVLAILITLLFMEARVISRRLALVVVVAAFLSILLAEVKVVFVLLPIMLAGVLRGRLIRNPLASLAILAGAAALLAALFVAYQQMYWAKVDSKTSDTGSALDYVLRADTNDRLVNYNTGEVSRLAAPIIWWRETSVRGANLVLFGHGPSASRVSETIGYGVAAKRYSFRLDTSTLTVLLWDLGLAGLFTFIAIPLVGAIAALRLARHPAIPPLHLAVLRAVPTAMVIVLVTLPYNRDAVDHSTLQLLICLLLGHVAYWHRRIGGAAAPALESSGDAVRGKKSTSS